MPSFCKSDESRQRCDRFRARNRPRRPASRTASNGAGSADSAPGTRRFPWLLRQGRRDRADVRLAWRLADPRRRYRLGGGGVVVGRPLPISYTPFGDFVVCLLFGVVAVGGTFYLQTFAIGPDVLIAATMVGLPAVAVIVVTAAAQQLHVELDRVSPKGVAAPASASARHHRSDTARSKNFLLDPRKRPVVVVAPRAGQRPGIGGFNADSQIGAALPAGHPVYLRDAA